MQIDFRNTNSCFATVLTETLKRLGLATAVVCPGSRSTPLAIAFAQQAGVEAIPVLDERCASFFALGIARQHQSPVVLVCSSGTAGANFYPAVIEARESRVPLLVFTADRPPELRDCHSGQTVDQLKLFGTYPNWQAELAPPTADMSMLSYWRQTVIHAWERSLYPVPGPVHLNIPFRDPLAPIPQLEAGFLKSQFQPQFFSGITHAPCPMPPALCPLPPIAEWQQCVRGVIIAGPAQPRLPLDYCAAIAQLSQSLGWPVLAEGLSPVRNHAQLNLGLISTYDLILRSSQLADQLAPEMVIQVGELPTSKELRTWLNTTQPRRWVIDPSHHNFDPLHGKTTHLRTSVEQLALLVGATRRAAPTEVASTGDTYPSQYLQWWCIAEAKVRLAINQTMTTMSQMFEGKAAWLLSQTLPSETPLFIANSMPVRDVESFWKPSDSAVKPFFNRGANGIDGTLSTALGVAHRNQSSVMLTGDLSLLHDTNGFLLRNKFVGHLTILLINNNGGGIFEMLSVSKFDPPFEEFFATPQDIDFAQLCATYGVEYQLIQSWGQLKQCLNPLPTQGIRVLEVQTDRKADAKWRRDHLSEFASGSLTSYGLSEFL